MGAETGLRAYASESVADALRTRGAEPERAAAEVLVRRLHPGWTVDADGVPRLVDNLMEATYPPEDIGEPLACEAPFWAGAHPVERIPGQRPNQDPYPLPFHPLEMGEEALRALLGFVLGGRQNPEDVDAFDIPVHGFRLIDRPGRRRGNARPSETP